MIVMSSGKFGTNTKEENRDCNAVAMWTAKWKSNPPPATGQCGLTITDNGQNGFDFEKLKKSRSRPFINISKKTRNKGIVIIRQK